MSRSQNVADYFEAPISTLKSGAELTFDVHFHLPRNGRMIVWRSSGMSVSADEIEKAEVRGNTKVWVLVSERATYERWCAPQLKTEHTPPPAEPLGAITAIDTGPRTAEGALLTAVLDSPDMSDEQKKAVITEVARTLVLDVADATTATEQKKADKKMRRTLEDVLDHAADRAESAVHELWKLGGIDPELSHAINVSAYASVFAMAFGRIDQELINDIALAGLLHDVGLAHVPAHLATVPWRSMSPEDRAVYSTHVGIGVRLIERHGQELPPRVRTLVEQHHEKFDGTGYPNGLKAFQVDDIAQLIAMADVLEAMKSGEWDGKERTLRESLEDLEKLEKRRTFPENFNPDILKAVLRWIRGASLDQPELEENLDRVASVVGAQARRVIK